MRMRTGGALAALFLAFFPAPIPAQPEPSSSFTGSSWCPKHGHYQGMECPGCAAERRSENKPLPVDPRVVALQNAIPRYDTLIRSLGAGNLVDQSSWLALPHGTEADFLAAANQLHRTLVTLADGNRRRGEKLREELATLEALRQTYPGQIAKLRTENDSARVESSRLADELADAGQQLELTQRTSRQLEAAAQRYAEVGKRDQETILNWLTVLLPPDLVKTVSPRPYESVAEPLIGAVPVRQQEPEIVEPPKPVALNMTRLAVPPADNPAPLTGTPESAADQLEADGTALRRAMAANGGYDLSTAVSNLQPVVEQLRQERNEARDEQEKLAAEAKTYRAQQRDAAWNLLIARDALQSAQATFLYRAADAWIWENARTEAVNRVKQEVRRAVTAAATGMDYREVTDVEMHEFIRAGRSNIFALGEQVLSAGDGLTEVLNQIQTLRTHGQGYATEAVRLAALGTPQEITAFTDGLFQSLDKDSEQLAKANLGAMEIPEPWKTIAAHHLIRK